MRMRGETGQPTIMRLNASITKHTYTPPAQVGTNVRSVTQSPFGAVAVNSRFTRSGCRAQSHRRVRRASYWCLASVSCDCW